MTEEEIKALIDERCAKIEAKIEAIIHVCNERITTKFKAALSERLVATKQPTLMDDIREELAKTADEIVRRLGK